LTSRSDRKRFPGSRDTNKSSRSLIDIHGTAHSRLNSKLIKIPKPFFKHKISTFYALCSKANQETMNRGKFWHLIEYLLEKVVSMKTKNCIKYTNSRLKTGKKLVLFIVCRTFGCLVFFSQSKHFFFYLDFTILYFLYFQI
jgi:hypothetical protein